MEHFKDLFGQELLKEVDASKSELDKLDSGLKDFVSKVEEYLKGQTKNGKLTKALEGQLQTATEYASIAITTAKDLQPFVDEWNKFAKKIDSSDVSKWKDIYLDSMDKLNASTSTMFIRDASKWEGVDYLIPKVTISGDDANKLVKRHSNAKGSSWYKGGVIGNPAFADKHAESVVKDFLDGKDITDRLGTAPKAVKLHGPKLIELYSWKAMAFSIYNIKVTQQRIARMISNAGKDNFRL